MPAIFRGWRVRIILKKQRCAFKIQGLYRSRKARKLANTFRLAKMNQCVGAVEFAASFPYSTPLDDVAARAPCHQLTFAACSWYCPPPPAVCCSDQKVQYAINRLFRRNLVRCLNSWKDLVKQARRSRRLLARAMKYDVRTRFQLWAEFVYRAKQARLAVANALFRVFKSRRYVGGL